jgi:hypothetical protein
LIFFYPIARDSASELATALQNRRHVRRQGAPLRRFLDFQWHPRPPDILIANLVLYAAIKPVRAFDEVFRHDEFFGWIAPLAKARRFQEFLKKRRLG